MIRHNAWSFSWLRYFMITQRLRYLRRTCWSELRLQMRNIINLMNHILLIFRLKEHGLRDSLDLGSEFKFRFLTWPSCGLALLTEIQISIPFNLPNTVTPQLVGIDGGISYQVIGLGVLLIYFQFFAIIHFIAYFVAWWTIKWAFYVVNMLPKSFSPNIYPNVQRENFADPPP